MERPAVRGIGGPGTDARVVIAMRTNRLLIVANRLPVTADLGTGAVQLVPSSGGLATGLRSWHERSNGLWFGWPGEVAPIHRAQIDARLSQASQVPVHLTAAQVAGYYHGFANRVLWPLFHYSVDRVPADAQGWTAYQAVNELFADRVAREYRTGDTIWVHDYHLLLLPDLLRQRLPDAQIGFFLHIPFPSSEVFRVLPWRREILKGLVGADLIGFHTYGYMRHFLTSLLHVEGLEAQVDSITVRGREVKVGVFPMGVDAARFEAMAADSQVRMRVDAIRRDADGRRIVLGVDRLDYTKGIPRRLEAIAHLLNRDPELRDRMRYIQIAIPSRGEVDSYQRFRRDVEEMVGRMNGAYGTVRSTPIHYVHTSVSPQELVALYCAADVMLVTPLRDGMNLVAKEFAASRIDEDGVLVLSEFAGAAAELQGALTINPYDVNAVAENIQRGFAMSSDERRARMRILRRQVRQHDVFAWANAFVAALQRLRPHEPRIVCRPPDRPLATVLADAAQTRRLRLLLDYDGTLVPVARSPELAAPDRELIELLQQLTSSPDIQVDIVSGRPRESLERWFGDLPVSLWAEHGFWRRARGNATWLSALPLHAQWMARVRPILEQFAGSTPGADVEAKTASLAWHYSGAARDFGARQAHELRLLLGDLLSNQPVEVLQGKKVIEVRMRGVSKALVAHRIDGELENDVVLMAIGDARANGELFRALPSGAISVAVGESAAAARFRVDDHRSVRKLLFSLLASGASERQCAREAMSA
jgi:trehalose 6-phosphate synthase/phosphatase